MPATNTIAATLIGLMVSCPFLCFGEASNTVDGSAWSDCQGTCCASEAPCDEVPADGRPSNEGSNCLCHGAVLAGPIETGHRLEASRDAYLAFQRAFDTGSTRLGHRKVSTGPSDCCVAGTFRPLSTGRDILSATAALLL